MSDASPRFSGRLQDGTECVLYLDEDGPRLEVDRDHHHPLDMFSPSDEQDRLVMRITDSKCATLTGAYSSRTLSNFSRSFTEYRANVTYIGPTEFHGLADIKRITFRPTNERLAVLYRGHRIHSIVDSDQATLSSIYAQEKQGGRYFVDIIDNERRCAFEATAGGIVVSGSVHLTVKNDVQGHETVESRVVSLKYDNPTDVTTAFSDMLSVCDFMSLMIGLTVSPVTIEIVTEGAPDHYQRPPSFEVYAHWREAGKEVEPKHGRRCLAAPLFDQAAYVAALAAWLNRKEEWSTSHALGTVCFSHPDEISSRRFLDAAAWFESIPASIYERARDRIPKDIISAAAKAAAAVFADKEIDVSEGRTRALLGQLNAASLSARIEDALTFARMTFGEEQLPPSLDYLGAMIPRIRGKFAHGDDPFTGELGHLVYDATLLLEVLSGALTLSELGVRIAPEMGGHKLRRGLFELMDFSAPSLIE